MNEQQPTNDGQAEVVENETVELDSDQPSNAEPTPAYQPTLPHPVEENPLDHVGEETKDPWSDSEQKDWPNSESTDGDATGAFPVVFSEQPESD